MLIQLSLIFHKDIDVTRFHCSIPCANRDPITIKNCGDTFERKYGERSIFKCKWFKDWFRDYCREVYNVEWISQIPQHKQAMKNFWTPERRKEQGKKSAEIFKNWYYNLTPEEHNEWNKMISNLRNSRTPEQRALELQRCQETCMKLYNVSSYSQTKEFKDLWKDPDFYERTVIKGFETRRKNGTLNTSLEEDSIYEKLCNTFGIINIKRQYKTDKYPFNCDFYIVSQDLYIECNFGWIHNNHFYDKNSIEDQQQLLKWKNKNTEYYNNAINTWTIRDIKKRDTAILNNLNYLVFWNIKDAEQWINNQSK